MKKRILTLVGVLALVAVLVVPMALLAADNEASQGASTGKSAAISIVGKIADTAVGTVTFPEGAPDATVSDPYNNVDTVADPQVLHASASDPVVRLKNTSAGTLTVWLEITGWTAAAVSEDYELVDTGTTTVAVVDDVLSSDGNAASVDTSVTMATTTYKALYLEITLSSSSGASGTSTLSILGET